MLDACPLHQYSSTVVTTSPARSRAGLPGLGNPVAEEPEQIGGLERPCRHTAPAADRLSRLLRDDWPRSIDEL